MAILNTILYYFTDPVLRAPTIASMLMCLAASLTGVIAFLKKQSLIGETLSHSTYPGMLLGVVFVGALGSEDNEAYLTFILLITSFFSALIAYFCIHFLERFAKVRSDAALTFILSSFFGIGITLASRIQFTHTKLYKQSLSYLFGQAATMTDIHIVIYGVLSLIVILFISLSFKELEAITFDRNYALSLNIPVRAIENLIICLIVLSVVIGIRSVGVTLMSAMLIAPAISARQFTSHLSKMLALAAFFGLLSAFLGNFFSVELSQWISSGKLRARATFPTGPSIVIVASLICILSLLCTAKRRCMETFSHPAI